MIEVGEYVRTPYGRIEKVERIDKAGKNIYDDIVITNINAYGLSWLNNYEIKHSKDITDLIKARRLCEWNVYSRNTIVRKWRDGMYGR